MTALKKQQQVLVAELRYLGSDTGFETDNTTLSTALNITAQLSDTVEWTTTLGVNEDESVTDVFFSDITTERNSIGTEFAFKLGDTNRLTVGAEYFDEEVETLSDFPETERDNTAAYAQLQTSSGAFGFVGSIRYDDNSAYGDDRSFFQSIVLSVFWQPRCSTRRIRLI